MNFLHNTIKWEEISIKKWGILYIIVIFILFLSATQTKNIIGSNLSVSVLDVGQGDAILIQTPEYKNILIDAGENGVINEELGKQVSFFKKKIQLAVITHPHRDHFGGFLEVLQKYPIESIMFTGVVSHDPMYTSLINEITKRKIPIIFPSNDKDIEISPNTFLDVIYPFKDQGFIGQEVKNKNNTSIVIRLVRNGESLILLTGDAEHEEEKEILLAGQEIESPILKLGHHGSRTATSDEFLKAVNPKTVVISAGIGNKFNHPHKETMEKVKNLDVRKTMEGGTVQFNF